MTWLASRFLLGFIIMLGLAPMTALGQDATPVASSLPEGVTIVANGLDNPRNFTWDEDGTLYLAIAGTGGPSMGLIDGAESGLTGGPTASVVALENGCANVVADGLPSGLWEGVGWVWGTADVAFLDGQLYQLASGGGSDYGNFETPAGLYRVGDDGSSTLVADYSAWSRENMPEFIPPDFNADGTLNDMLAGEERLWVVDAVSGRIVTITPDGEITLFKDYSVDHRVPTGIVPDGEGGLFVSELTVIPYPEGEAKVVQIAADGEVTDHWTGLTALTSLALGTDDALYASELATGSMDEDPFLVPNSGRVVRQTGPDSHEVVVTDIHYPVSIGFGPDGALYVATPAFGTGDGAGQGALLRIDPSAPRPVSLAGVDLSAPTCAGAVETASSAAAPASAEQDDSAAAPAAMQTLARVPLAGQAIDTGQVMGVIRVTFDTGGSQEVSAGSGAMVLFVEEGSLALIPAADAPPPLVSRAGSADAAPAPEAAGSGETALAVGDAVLLPAGGAAEIRNAGDAPASVLRLLAASDEASAAETGVTRAILVRDVEANLAPEALLLERTTLPAGGQIALPQAPAQGVVAGLDRGQAIYLSPGSTGTATNRSPDPMEIYLVSLEPAS